MFATKRVRIAAATLALAIASAGTAVALTTSASAAAKAAPAAPAHTRSHVSPLDLNGFVVNAKYTQGRNTGNTFQQTYGHSMVQGVPIAGPFVGVKFPPEDYVALPIGNHELYISWLDPKTFAIVDVFVMNLATRTVFDYAPGSATPQSWGRITVVHGIKHH